MTQEQQIEKMMEEIANDKKVYAPPVSKIGNRNYKTMTHKGFTGYGNKAKYILDFATQRIAYDQCKDEEIISWEKALESLHPHLKSYLINGHYYHFKEKLLTDKNKQLMCRAEAKVQKLLGN